FAAIVVSRQRTGGLFGRTLLALAMGLICWSAGDVIWTYQTIFAQITPSDLSTADLPWLSLYIFFGYYVFNAYRYFGKAVPKQHVVIVAGIVAALSVNSVYSPFMSYEKSSSNQHSSDALAFIAAVVRSTYPIGDAVIVVPSILLLITLRRGLL